MIFIAVVCVITDDKMLNYWNEEFTPPANQSVGISLCSRQGPMSHDILRWHDGPAPMTHPRKLDPIGRRVLLFRQVYKVGSL